MFVARLRGAAIRSRFTWRCRQCRIDLIVTPVATRRERNKATLAGNRSPPRRRCRTIVALNHGRLTIHTIPSGTIFK
jgi:hypothetical protein